MKPIAPIDQMIAMYEAGASSYAIAKHFGMHQSNVLPRLKHHGVQLRPPNPNSSKRLAVSTDELKSLYEAGFSTHHLADKFGCTAKSMKDRLKRGGVTFRPRSQTRWRRGADHGLWKGGRIKDPQGYIGINVGHGKRRAEHRLVMERVIGRRLRRDEVVHHINGIRDDNRPENLVVTTPRAHEPRTLVRALQRRVLYLESLLGQRGEKIDVG